MVFLSGALAVIVVSLSVQPQKSVSSCLRVFVDVSKDGRLLGVQDVSHVRFALQSDIGLIKSLGRPSPERFADLLASAGQEKGRFVIPIPIWHNTDAFGRGSCCHDDSVFLDVLLPTGARVAKFFPIPTHRSHPAIVVEILGADRREKDP